MGYPLSSSQCYAGYSGLAIYRTSGLPNATLLAIVYCPAPRALRGGRDASGATAVKAHFDTAGSPRFRTPTLQLSTAGPRFTRGLPKRRFIIFSSPADYTSTAVRPFGGSNWLRDLEQTLSFVNSLRAECDFPGPTSPLNNWKVDSIPNNSNSDPQS